jgi:hypothetical protein
LEALQLGEAGPMANARRLLNKPQFSETSTHMLAMPQGTVSTPTATTESATASTSIGFEIVTALPSDHQAGKSSGNSSSMEEVQDYDTSDWLQNFNIPKLYKHSQFGSDWYFNEFKLGDDEGNYIVLFLEWQLLSLFIYKFAFWVTKLLLVKREVNKGHLEPFESAFNDAEIITQAMNLRWVDRSTEFLFYIIPIGFILLSQVGFLGCHIGFLVPNALFSMNPNALQRFSPKHYVACRRVIVMLCTFAYAMFAVLLSSLNLGIQAIALGYFVKVVCSDTPEKHKKRKEDKQQRDAKRENADQKPALNMGERARFIL